MVAFLVPPEGRHVGSGAHVVPGRYGRRIDPEHPQEGLKGGRVVGADAAAHSLVSVFCTEGCTEGCCEASAPGFEPELVGGSLPAPDRVPLNVY